MKIMIVDDNPAIRTSIRRILSGGDDTFHECSDGTEAVESYPTIHPDWVLMDVKMKRMDGFQATREILTAFPDARIIMITQYNDAMFREKALEVGAFEFVLKDNLVDVARIIEDRVH